eukprot:TRINITY_DN12700_c0_g1_i1.p3 TRINITY_DN12700_c0_g1~~TRINITY_DN12700_c0_g1_i1.p3  ORF type:complete len:114 (+),score=6.34 TRINITY_DN12700_c0_g1_i1:621-962(+)
MASTCLPDNLHHGGCRGNEPVCAIDIRINKHHRFGAVPNVYAGLQKVPGLSSGDEACVHLNCHGWLALGGFPCFHRHRLIEQAGDNASVNDANRVYMLWPGLEAIYFLIIFGS